MHLTKLFQWSMVGEQNERPSSQVGIEMIHSPQSGLHLKEKWRVVAFMLLHFSAGVGDDVVFTFFIELCENSP